MVLCTGYGLYMKIVDYIEQEMSENVKGIFSTIYPEWTENKLIYKKTKVV